MGRWCFKACDTFPDHVTAAQCYGTIYRGASQLVGQDHTLCQDWLLIDFLLIKSLVIGRLWLLALLTELCE